MYHSLILIILIIFIITYYYLIWNFNYWKTRGVEGPTPKPYVGTFPGIALFKRNIIYDIEDIYRKYNGKVPFVGVFSGRIPKILALDPEFIKDVIIRNFQSFHVNEAGHMVDNESDPIRARHPFILNGTPWKLKRGEMTPALTVTKLKSIFPIVQDCCRKMTNYIKEEIRSSAGGINARELAARYTIEVASNYVYGIDAKAFTNSNVNSDDLIVLRMATKLFLSFRQLVFFNIFAAFPFLTKYFRPRLLSKLVENFFVDIFRSSMENRKINIQNGSVRDDFLNYLLNLQKLKGINEIDLAAHTITFLTDGFDTSSVVMSFILYELAKHQCVQDRLREEVNELISKSGEITYDNMNELTYLDQVLNEAIRMHPPVPFLSKVCTNPVTYDNYNGHSVTIEKDTVIMIPIYAIQHSEKYYSDPEYFNPDRFNGGLKTFRESGIYLSFNEGPRMCPGRNYAIAQAKVMIIEMIKNFNISLNKETCKTIIFDKQHFFNTPEGNLLLDFTEL